MFLPWMSRARLCLSGLALAGLLHAPFAAAQSLGRDLPGASDHPVVSRFAGAQLIGHQALDFDRGSFFGARRETGYDPAKELDTEKTSVVEGRVTRLVYMAPPGKTALEVHRNFEQALRQAGLRTVTSVDGTGGRSWWEAGPLWRAGFDKARLQAPFAGDIPPFAGEGLYLHGTLERGGAPLNISVLTGPASVFARGHYKVPENTALTAVALQIVEGRPMATGQVTVNVDGLRKGLEADGRIALYGLYFDTGKADVKPESAPQLAAMAELLRGQPALRVYIVGHTDNVGNLEANLALSQRRAQAVVDALVKDGRIDAQRLGARGVGPFSPVASNREETGRARNRRVELVAQ